MVPTAKGTTLVQLALSVATSDVLGDASFRVVPRARFLSRDLLAALGRFFARSGVNGLVTFGQFDLLGRDAN